MKKHTKYFKLFLILLSIPLIITQINSTNKHFLRQTKSILTTKNGKATRNKQPIEDNKIESLDVDCAFSVGGWCICAEHLRYNNLRITSSPLDWMRKYSLDTVAHLFRTKFKDFFKNAKVTQKMNRNGMRTIYDAKNHIESIHYVPADIPFDDAFTNFEQMMEKRAQKVDQIISNSKSILLVNCRNRFEGSYNNSTDRELKKFATAFSEIYPNLEKIYLMDIHDDANTEIRRRIVDQDKKIKIIQYKFKNIDYVNFSPPWMGNQDAWNKILKQVHLTEKPQRA